MRQKRAAGTGGGEKTIRDIQRATRRQYSAEAKIRIVLDGPRTLGFVVSVLRQNPDPVPILRRRLVQIVAAAIDIQL